jgi:hypothetical protein
VLNASGCCAAGALPCRVPERLHRLCPRAGNTVVQFAQKLRRPPVRLYSSIGRTLLLPRLLSTGWLF